METSSLQNNQHKDLHFDQSGLGKSSDDDCMVLEGLEHFIVFLAKYIAIMRRLLQEVECKK
jgi:hypothetical protein